MGHLRSTKLIVLQGIPASGKSTWAKKVAEEHPNTYVIINRDNIRNMLGKYWVPIREPLVSIIEEQMANAALDLQFNVIIDATNLNPKTIRKWTTVADNANVELRFKQFHIPKWKAILRDYWRGIKGGKRVGKKVIDSFYARYKDKL
jgi:predicted kinase